MRIILEAGNSKSNVCSGDGWQLFSFWCTTNFLRDSLDKSSRTSKGFNPKGQAKENWIGFGGVGAGVGVTRGVDVGVGELKIVRVAELT